MNGLDRILQIFAIVLLAIVTVSVTWQVVSRYITEDSAPWTAELAAYAFVWLSMIAIALGVRRGRHMLLDIWEYLPYRRWIIVTIHTFAAFVVIAVLALLIWFGWENLAPGFRRIVPGLGIAYGWVSLAVPVGSAFALIFAIEAWWRTIHTYKGEEPADIPVLYQPADAVIIKGEI